MSNIIVIPFSELLAPAAAPAPAPAKVRYAILINRTPSFIAAWRRRTGNGDVYIFPFFNGPVAGAPDFRRCRSDYVVKPWYVGNFVDWRLAVKQIIAPAIEQISALHGHPLVELVLDESLI